MQNFDTGTRMNKSLLLIVKLAFALAVGSILLKASRVFFGVAWGAGDWLGGFLPKWGVGFFLFSAGALTIWVALVWGLLRPERVVPALGPVVNARERSGWLRWPIILAAVLLTPWLFQYTYVGIAFIAPAVRITIWTVCVLLCAFLLTHDPRQPIVWKSLLTAILLCGAAVLLAFPLQDVSSYPFSLGWSEGNRLYDYSILFGRERYIYPQDAPLAPYLDLGRQVTGGLAFLYSGLTIWQARLWQGLMGIIPYAALGLAIFRRPRGASLWVWILAGLWGYAFLRQGPIHTPLILIAFCVALLWRQPLWLAMPLLALVSYATAYSRFTWVFAPSMWVAMLTLVSAALENGRLPGRAWLRAVLLAAAAVSGGVFYWATGLLDHTALVSQGTKALSHQPLLWYRLFPNETLGPGILAILLIATLPLILVLIFLARPSRWPMNLWQRLVILGSLSAFLVVGLVASTKIGGGGDLHNLDMFLIGLLFTAGLAWEKHGEHWMFDAGLPLAMKAAVIMMLALPVYFPLVNMRPLLTDDAFPSLKLLTGAESPRELGLLPTTALIEDALTNLQLRINYAGPGEILFMDQRQLLTFGFIEAPLVPDYEKKFLMDRAMTDSAVTVFSQFYADLEAHRFALIISDPLRIPVKGQEAIFGEENDAWVKWVSSAVLCYYEPDKTYADFRIQVLIPRKTPLECDLPIP